MVERAKKQAQSVPAINGHPLTATYVHPAALTLAYYLPLVDALRTRQTETVSLDGEDYACAEARVPGYRVPVPWRRRSRHRTRLNMGGLADTTGPP
ncbi:hypothetical protein GCM10027436_53050 [Actinophytocola sediminis]